MISHRQAFLRYNAQTSLEPLMLEVVKGEGHYLIDVEGRRYFDAISGISVSSVGHCHPKIVKAVKDQSETLMHSMVYGEHVLAPQVKLAQKLDEWVGRQIAGTEPLSTYLVNSGTEAAEAAIKLSRRATGRSGILAFQNSYHGSTTGALALMGNAWFRDPFEPLLPGVRHAPYNDINAVHWIDEQIGAVFLEIVQSESGYIPGNIDFIESVARRCKETGTLLVIDEIQSGIGRTGLPFAFMHYNIIPDMVLSAKGLGGGMPIGALMCRKSLMDLFSHDPYLGHITTFGGHPVCAASALACIEVIQEGQFMDQVNPLSNHFCDLIEQNGLERPKGKGWMLSLATGSYGNSWKMMHRMMTEGVLTDWFLHEPGRVRMAPPLTITKEEVEWLAQIFGKCLLELNN